MKELPFQSNEFKEVWEDFIAHRKQAKHPLTQTAIKRIFNKLKSVDEQTAIKALDQSIEKGYRGVFPEQNERRFVI